jgi:hypothetical protein
MQETTVVVTESETVPVPSQPLTSFQPQQLSPRKDGKKRCIYGNRCNKLSDPAHCEQYVHNDSKIRCRNGAACPLLKNPKHRDAFAHPSTNESTNIVKREICPAGRECTKINDDEHGRLYLHGLDKKKACKYGIRCKLIDDIKHRNLYIHLPTTVSEVPPLNLGRLPPSSNGNRQLSPISEDENGKIPECKFGAGCTNYHADHMEKWLHPERKQKPCKFAENCTEQDQEEHAARFSHPEKKIKPCRNGPNCAEKTQEEHAAKFSH